MTLGQHCAIIRVSKSHRDTANVRWSDPRNGVPMDTSDHTTKMCRKCGAIYPATPQFFSRKASSRDGLYSRCKSCQHEYNAKYIADHREELNASKRIYIANNRDKVREYNRNYRRSHPAHRVQTKSPEYSRLKAKIWRLANPDRIRELEKQSRDRRRDKIREKDKRYREANPDRMRLYRMRRSKREHDADGHEIVFDSKAQLKRQKGRCYYCAQKIEGKYHVDHIVPISRGGTDHPDNKVVSCPRCNLQKNDKLPHEWVKGGRLL